MVVATNLLDPANKLLFPCFVNGEPRRTKATFPVFDPHDRTRTLRDIYGVDVDEAAIAVEAAADALFGP